MTAMVRKYIALKDAMAHPADPTFPIEPLRPCRSGNPHAYSKGSAAEQARFATALAMAVLAVWPSPLRAAPTGGSVVAGQATISQSGATTNINQSTNKAIINWLGFSIGANETVNFNQPNSMSVTLNRVVGNERSVISGALNANGQVFIVNASGVLITKNAAVNVGGLTVSTLGISNQDFMGGNYKFEGTSAAAVINKGHIHASDGGTVALLGKTVANDGVIAAKLGTVVMAAGEKISLNFGGNSMVDVTIDKGTMNALVANKRLIKADGGTVIMTAKAADSVLSAQVNNTGIIQARSMTALKGGSNGAGTVHVGTIKLIASGGTVHVAGRLDASAPKGGKGGTIETSGDRVVVANNAVITTKSSTGQNGTWTIDPTDFTITDGTAAQTASGIGAATLDANLGNGNVIITTVAAGTDAGNINVNATLSWSANTTLTLNAANDIDVNAAINASGNSAGLALNAGNNININANVSLTGTNAGLVMNYGGYANTGTAAANTNYTINMANSASVTLSGGNATLSINGQAYTLIHSMSDLEAISAAVIDPITGQQAIDPNSDLPIWAAAAGHYALAQNLDASGTTYSGPLVNALSGTLAGLGHTINNVTVNATAPLVLVVNGVSVVSDEYNTAALIGGASSGSIIRDLGLTNVNMAGGGEAGGLAGSNSGTISNVSVTGTVSGYEVGGLVYGNQGTIINSSTNVAVSGVADVGGLVGFNFGTGIISNSSANGTVNAIGRTLSGGGVMGSDEIGGLVGANAGKIINSQAKGDVNVTDGTNVGGLVGYNFNGGSITGSSASGKVTVNATNSNVYSDNNGIGIGGLVGNNNGGSVDSSTATGDVVVNAANGTAISNVGGLVGWNSTGTDGTGGNISNSTATGNVTGTGFTSNLGGFVGNNIGGTISNSTASGNVSGGSGIGGFAGNNNGSIILSTATGSATGTNNVGGFVGNNSGLAAGDSASGNASGVDGVGGFAGNNSGLISGGSSSGNVTGETNVGGFVGDNGGRVTNSKASGQITVTDPFFSSNVGAFAGNNGDGTISNGTYDVTSANSLNAIGGGSGTVTNVTGTVGALTGGNTGTGTGTDTGTGANQGDSTSSNTSSDNTTRSQTQSEAAAASTGVVSSSEEDRKAADKLNPAAAAAAGTKAISAVAPPKLEDNIKIEQPAALPTAPPEKIRPVNPRHAAAMHKPAARRGGFGASIHSIEIDGQHFDLDDKSKTTAPDQKAK